MIKAAGLDDVSANDSAIFDHLTEQRRLATSHPVTEIDLGELEARIKGLFDKVDTGRQRLVSDWEEIKDILLDTLKRLQQQQQLLPQ